MDHSSRALERRSHRIGITNISGSYLQLEMTESFGATGCIPHKRADRPSLLRENSAGAFSDETRGTCDDYWLVSIYPVGLGLFCDGDDGLAVRLE
jgi:hypothetical protein